MHPKTLANNIAEALYNGEIPTAQIQNLHQEVSQWHSNLRTTVLRASPNFHRLDICLSQLNCLIADLELPNPPLFCIAQRFQSLDFPEMF